MTILDSDKCTDGKQIRKYFLEKREKKKGAQNIHITCYKLKSLTAVD